MNNYSRCFVRCAVDVLWWSSQKQKEVQMWFSRPERRGVTVLSSEWQHMYYRWRVEERDGMLWSASGAGGERSGLRERVANECFADQWGAERRRTTAHTDSSRQENTSDSKTTAKPAQTRANRHLTCADELHQHSHLQCSSTANADNGNYYNNYNNDHIHNLPTQYSRAEDYLVYLLLSVWNKTLNIFPGFYGSNRDVTIHSTHNLIFSRFLFYKMRLKT